MNLYPGTNVINLNEPCYGLYELDYQSPGSKGFHRYQIIVVMRNDAPAEFVRDMGKANKFKGVAQVRIPGGFRDDTTGRFEIVHTVQELMEIADEWRHEPQKPYEAPDWTGLYHDQLEINKNRRKGKLQFAANV